MIQQLKAAAIRIDPTDPSTSESPSLPTCGKLARLDHEGMQAGARVDSTATKKQDARTYVEGTKAGEPT
jgi:hypothetical protein